MAKVYSKLLQTVADFSNSPFDARPSCSNTFSKSRFIRGHCPFDNEERLLIPRMIFRNGLQTQREVKDGFE